MGGGATALSQAYLSRDAKTETQTLIAGDEFRDEGGQEDENKGVLANQTLLTGTVIVGATCMLVVNIMVMAIYGAALTFVSGTLSSVVAVVVFASQLRLENIDSKCLQYGYECAHKSHTSLMIAVCFPLSFEKDTEQFTERCKQNIE